jgi:hemolysin D
LRLKLATYQFQKYGFLEGVVKTVSADSTAPRGGSPSGSDEQELSFKALVELKSQRLESNPNLALAAGMQVSAEIVQGRRTVLVYLLSPVQRVTSEAAMER